MVSQMGKKVQFGTLTKYFVMFTMVSVMTVALAAPASYAQQAPEAPQPIVPGSSVPAVCSTAPQSPFVAGIRFAPTAPTNNAALQWSWTFTPPAPVDNGETGESPEAPETPVENPAEEPAEEPTQAPVEQPAQVAFALTGYKYALYNGATLQVEGVLDAATTTFSYSAPNDAPYTLYVWTAAEEGSEAAYCGNAAIILDTTPPAITNGGFTLTGRNATTLLTTNESNVTYSWTVSGVTNGARISDVNVLNPTFTFQRDGTYTFTLVATDALGNSSSTVMRITYVAPFIPGELPIIPEESIPVPTEAFTPIVERQAATATVYAPTRDTPLAPEVDASVYASTATGREASRVDEKSVTSVVSVSQGGWKILGITWYWWLLAVAIIVTTGLWVLRTYRSRFADDV